jgi:hypothetical protein
MPPHYPLTARYRAASDAPAAVIPCAISSRISSLLINIFLSMGLSVHTLADRLIDAPPNGGRIHAFPLVLPAVS